MPRKQHTHHFIYKTTCKVTGKFYIGMHSTSNLEDGYLGSGKYLWNSIRKHGTENHEIEIIEWFDNKNSLKFREIELVNEEMLKNPMCMNLRLGGGGIQKGTKLSDETRKKMSQSRSETHKQNISKGTIGKLLGIPKSDSHKEFYKKMYSGKKLIEILGSEEKVFICKKKKSESLIKAWNVKHVQKIEKQITLFFERVKMMNVSIQIVDCIEIADNYKGKTFYGKITMIDSWLNVKIRYLLETLMKCVNYAIRNNKNAIKILKQDDSIYSLNGAIVNIKIQFI